MRFDEEITQEDQQESSFDPVPPGPYDIVVSNIEDTVSKKGHDMLNMEFEIVGPTHAGRKIWERWTFPPADEGIKALSISRSKMAALAQACGIERINDTDKLIGKRCKARVGIQPSDDPKYGPSNVVKRFEKPDNEGASAARNPFD